jgi:hypothetical protein
VILNAPVSEVVERVPPSVGVLEAIDENTCMLQTGSQSLTILAVWIGMIGVEFEVEEPAELVEHIREVADRFHRATRIGG